MDARPLPAAPAPGVPGHHPDQRAGHAAGGFAWLANRTGAPLWTASVTLGGRRLRRVLSRDPRAVAPVLPVLWPAGRFRALWLAVAETGALQAAVLGFGLNYAAYEAEIYRAGIGAIPVGQWEAAASLGMSRPLCFRAIILPQAIRIILPPMTNDFIALFKDTSVVSVIAVVELTKQYQILAKSSLKYLEIGLVTALLYLVMSVPLGYLSRSLEARWGKGS